MDRNNRGNRYQDDDRTSNYNRRNNEYDRDRNYNDWDQNYRNNPGRENATGNDYRNAYSSDGDRDTWYGRSNDLSDYNRSYNRPDSSYMNREGYRNNNNSSHNRDYNNRYRNEGWRDNYRDENRDWWDKTKDEVSSWFGDDDASRRRRMDSYREGQHKGKGPKNYSRSPERIKEDASDKLSDDSLIDASNIDIEVKDNEVTLSGTVDTRYEKRRAEDLVENVSGVKNVQNNLRITSTNSWNDSTNINSNSATVGASNTNNINAKTRKENTIS